MNKEQNELSGSQEANYEEWRLSIKTKAATLECSYNAAPVVEHIVKNLRRILHQSGNDISTFDEAAKNCTQRILCNTLKSSLLDALKRSEIEAQKRTLRELSDDGFHLNSEKLSRWTEQEARNARSKARQRMGARMRGGSEAVYPLLQLSAHYEGLLRVWRDAKRIYRQNAMRRHWRDMVKVEHENLPDDLLDKLGLQGENKPSDLAIEHAARLCGVPANYYSIRHLRERLRSQR